MAETRITPPIREAILHGLAMVHASEQGFDGNIPYEGADRTMVPMALAAIAVALLDKLEEAGGDRFQALEDIYLAVTTENREDTP
jgi:hypothetical protein